MAASGDRDEPKLSLYAEIAELAEIEQRVARAAGERVSSNPSPEFRTHVRARYLLRCSEQRTTYRQIDADTLAERAWLRAYDKL